MAEDYLIKRLRQEKGLSRRELARLVGTSQNHFQRMEVGVLPIHLELAVRISEALRLPLGSVFPTLPALLEKFPGPKIKSESARSELGAIGIEVDDVVWVVDFGLNNGASEQFVLPSAEKRRLSQFLRNWDLCFGDRSEIPSFWFDSEDYSVCVNLSYLSYAHFTFEYRKGERSDGGAMTDEDICGKAPAIQVWMKGKQKPLEFRAEPDEINTGNDDDDSESGQLESLLIELDGNMQDDGFVSFVDGNGEYVYLRVADIAMIAIPQWLVKPQLLEDTEDPEDEEAATLDEDPPDVTIH